MIYTNKHIFLSCITIHWICGCFLKRCNMRIIGMKPMSVFPLNSRQWFIHRNTKVCLWWFNVILNAPVESLEAQVVWKELIGLLFCNLPILTFQKDLLQLLRLKFLGDRQTFDCGMLIFVHFMITQDNKILQMVMSWPWTFHLYTTIWKYVFGANIVDNKFIGLFKCEIDRKHNESSKMRKWVNVLW